MKNQNYKRKILDFSENKIKLPLIKINKGSNLLQNTKNKINLNKETKSPMKKENNNNKNNEIEEISKENNNNIKNIDDIIIFLFIHIFLPIIKFSFIYGR